MHRRALFLVIAASLAVSASLSAQQGLVKPEMTDTMQGAIYADNWFELYINGKLVAIDPIDFLPHNVVTIDLLPSYPMTIAVMVKDNADPKTGMEYGDHIGDGGFILKFSDGTVTSANWKVKTVFTGPLNKDTKNPKVSYQPIPKDWFAQGFDDKSWANATIYTQQRIDPKKTFFNYDFSGAQFIWSEDLDLDNTILLRTVVNKPGFVPRWNTKPDLDTSGAPGQ